MRTITIEKTLLKFDELNEAQKNKVIDKNRDINIDGCWDDININDFELILEHLGFKDVKINYTGFWSQGDGCSFKGCFMIPVSKKINDSRLENLKNDFGCTELIGLCTEILNCCSIDDLLESEKILISSNGRYCHEFMMVLDNSDNQKFLDNCRKLAKYFYRKLEENYNYLTSHEAISETLICNEYEFNSITLKIEV